MGCLTSPFIWLSHEWEMEAGLKTERRGYNMRGGAYIWEAGLKANSAHTEKTEFPIFGYIRNLALIRFNETPASNAVSSSLYTSIFATGLLFVYRFSGLTVPQHPYWRSEWFGKSDSKLVLSDCSKRVLILSLNVSVCYDYDYYYFADDLTQDLPQSFFYLLPETPWQPCKVTPMNYQGKGLLGNVVTTSLLRPYFVIVLKPCVAHPTVNMSGFEDAVHLWFMYVNKQGLHNIVHHSFIQFLNC